MHKLGIIVPYRNRKEQLEAFKYYIPKYLTNKGIVDYTIIVVDQADRKSFNRGKLLNIGFIEAKNRGCDYVVFHDVDMIPLEVDYGYSDKPLQIANKFIKDGDFDRTIQRNYFGGVTMFTVDDFDRINGYSNKYKGWGFEDDDLLLRCREVGLELEDEPYRSISFDKQLLYFNGKNSYIQIRNIYRTVRPFSYVTTFYPDTINCNPSEITDEFAVFGIPGHDLNLSFNSFSRYKFELFLKDNTPVSLTSDYIPNIPMQVVVNVNPKLRRIQYFINGKEVETKYWGQGVVRLYEDEPYVYLGAADPTREAKQKFFKGYISNFGIINGELSLEEVRKLFMSNPNKPLTETCTFLEDRWNGYFDSLNPMYETLFDSSRNTNTAEFFNCELKTIRSPKVTRVKYPYRREGLFKLFKHEEGGYLDGYWKDWSSRENQLRFYRHVNNGTTDFLNDGISTCRYRLSIEEESDKYIKLNTKT